MTTTKDIGDEWVTQATFIKNGAKTDPTTVTCKIIEPSGVQTDYVYGTDAELTRTEAGVYQCVVTLDASGRWKSKFVGTGAATAAGESRCVVRNTDFI